MSAVQAACDAAMARIRKGINASVGQHKRAISKAFQDAGAPVTGAVSVPAQKRIPLVSEGTTSARRINDPDHMRRAGCAFFGCNYPEGECAGNDLCTPRVAR